MIDSVLAALDPPEKCAKDIELDEENPLKMGDTVRWTLDESFDCIDVKALGLVLEILLEKI